MTKLEVFQAATVLQSKLRELKETWTELRPQKMKNGSSRQLSSDKLTDKDCGKVWQCPLSYYLLQDIFKQYQ